MPTAHICKWAFRIFKPEMIQTQQWVLIIHLDPPSGLHRNYSITFIANVLQPVTISTRTGKSFRWGIFSWLNVKDAIHPFVEQKTEQPFFMYFLWTWPLLSISGRYKMAEYYREKRVCLPRDYIAWFFNAKINVFGFNLLKKIEELD